MRDDLSSPLPGENSVASDLAAEKDETLLALIVQGSHAAFSALAERHAQRFYLGAYQLLQNREDAEDVVQEAFLKLWRQPGLWDPSRGTKFTTWFYRIVLNAALDLKRRRRVKIEPLDAAGEMPADSPVPDDVIDDKNRKLRVQNAIKTLPEHQRLALTLCFYQEFSNQEAADIMGMNIKALQSLIMRAKASLKNMLNDIPGPADMPAVAARRTS